MAPIREQLSDLCTAVLEAAPDPILVVDATGAIRIANREAERQFGYAQQDLVGQGIEVLVPEALRTRHVGHRAGYEKKPTVRPMGDRKDLTVRRADGSTFAVEITLSPLVLGGMTYTICIVRDATAKLEQRRELEYIGTHDALTDLYNRHYFNEELMRLGRGRSFPVRVIAADLDGLKDVNDELGHAAGDELIRRGARAIASSIRGDDVLARLGGDEFGVLLPRTDPKACLEILERIRAAMAADNEASAPPVLRLSLGCATAGNRDAFDQAVSEADASMYRDKNSRRPPGQRRSSAPAIAAVRASE